MAGDDPVFCWDIELRGYGCKVMPNGAKSFVAQYRSGGKTRSLKIGNYSPLAPDQARRSAIQVLGRVAAGGDPAAERKAERAATAAPTVAEVATAFLEQHVAEKKASTISGYRHLIAAYILPALGKKIAAEVTRGDIAKLISSMLSVPIQANRCRAVASTLFSWAEINGLVPVGHQNPCRAAPKFDERQRRRERFLNPAEAARSGEAIDNAERDGSITKDAANGIRLLMLTGDGCDEILRLEWSAVNFEHRSNRHAGAT